MRCSAATGSMGESVIEVRLTLREEMCSGAVAAGR
jgi:hypothetical protein